MSTKPAGNADQAIETSTYYAANDIGPIGYLVYCENSIAHEHTEAYDVVLEADRIMTARVEAIGMVFDEVIFCYDEIAHLELDPPTSERDRRIDAMRKGAEHLIAHLDPTCEYVRAAFEHFLSCSDDRFQRAQGYRAGLQAGTNDATVDTLINASYCLLTCREQWAWYKGFLAALCQVRDEYLDTLDSE